MPAKLYWNRRHGALLIPGADQYLVKYRSCKGTARQVERQHQRRILEGPLEGAHGQSQAAAFLLQSLRLEQPAELRLARGDDLLHRARGVPGRAFASTPEWTARVQVHARAASDEGCVDLVCAEETATAIEHDRFPGQQAIPVAA